ncbi:MAG: hypothetical protein QW148_04405 [Thermosphaera sp.]
MVRCRSAASKQMQTALSYCESPGDTGFTRLDVLSVQGARGLQLLRGFFAEW